MGQGENFEEFLRICGGFGGIMTLTMAPEAPQPCAEGVSLSGAMARQGGSLHHGGIPGGSSTRRRRGGARAVKVRARIQAGGGPASTHERRSEMRQSVSLSVGLVVEVVR